MLAPAPSSALVWTRRGVQLIVGLAFYGFGIGLMVRAGIGVAPWDVLAQGITAQTGLPFGIVVNIVGAFVLLLWIPIRQKPGLGTVANVLLIGPFAQLLLTVVPQQHEPILQGLVFALGLLLVGIATGMYVGARFGPGPRDGLMTGLHARTGWPIWVVRTGIEISVLIVGFVLGGQVGIGTLAFALLIGPIVNVTLPLLRVPGGLPVETKLSAATVSSAGAVEICSEHGLVLPDRLERERGERWSSLAGSR